MYGFSKFREIPTIFHRNRRETQQNWTKHAKFKQKLAYQIMFAISSVDLSGWSGPNVCEFFVEFEFVTK